MSNLKDIEKRAIRAAGEALFRQRSIHVSAFCVDITWEKDLTIS